MIGWWVGVRIGDRAWLMDARLMKEEELASVSVQRSI